MKILNLDEIKKRISLSQIIEMQEEGFKQYSLKKVNVPQVGHLKLRDKPLRYHIKYGVIDNDDIFIVKLAGGLEQSTKEFGPTKLEGLMIAISTRNGKPLYMLHDEGYLTQLRTAIAGLISAKYLAPKNVKAIGILGTGIQAKEQVKILKNYINCTNIIVWGRNKKNIAKYQQEMETNGYNVSIANTPLYIAENSNLIITTTASNEALLRYSDIQPGTHITALGADARGKQELDPMIFLKADIIAADSKLQCLDHGEIFHAYQKKFLKKSQIFELGEIIMNPNLRRIHDKQITICDLTGVAVQDIQITKAIIKYDTILEKS